MIRPTGPRISVAWRRHKPLIGKSDNKESS